MGHRLRSLDEWLFHALRPMVIPLLRVLLGLFFVWFGALKLTDSSPVADLVAGTLPWADPQLVVPLLGAAEVALGIGLLAGLFLGLVLPILAVHLAGTFLTFVMMPAQMFRDNDPLKLTADGEFVLKNLVLISATLVLMVHTQSSAVHETPGSPA